MNGPFLRIFANAMITTSKISLENVVRTKLPPLPGSAMRISTLLQDYSVSQQRISDAIGLDPMLATRVLRLANSPMYPFQQTVTRLLAAVSALGNKTIYELVLMGAFADSFGSEIKNSTVGREIWLHAVAVGIASRELTIALGMRGGEEAFSCGLLHDIGRLLLLRACHDEYVEMIERFNEHDMSEYERAVFGFDHAQVGALAARRWNLSESVADMIRYHHIPGQMENSTYVTHIVHVADRLADIKNYKLPFTEDFFESPSAKILKIDEEKIEAVWEKTVVNLKEVVKGFFAAA